MNALSKPQQGIDVVVAVLDDEEDENLVKQIIMSIPIKTIASADGDFFENLNNDPVDWSAMPLVLPSTGQVRISVDSWLRENNVTAYVYAEVPGNEAILSPVAPGCGVGFVPELVVKDSPLAQQVSMIEAGPALLDFHVGFCALRKSLDVSPIIRAFWAAI